MELITILLIKSGDIIAEIINENQQFIGDIAIEDSKISEIKKYFSN